MKELQYSALAAANYYALIFNGSAQVWNGAAFETFVDANIGNYDLPMTQEGTASLIYTADVPALAAGRYSAIVKTRAGGSPSISDALAGGPWTFDWDGAAVVAPAVTGAAMTLAAGSVTAAVVAADAGNELADALLDRSAGVETGWTLRQTLRILLSVLAGKVSGATTIGGTIKFRDMADSTDRVTAETDASGNRLDVETDVT
jgi:hypothetical protein